MQHGQHSRFHRFVSTYFWWIAGITFAGSMVVLTCPTWGQCESPPLKYLFEALLVSSFLAGTVEIFAKAKFLNEVAEDLFKAMIGHRLPVQIQQHIQDITHTSLVRHDFEIRYTITPLSRDKVMVDVQWSFSVVNYNFEPVEFAPILQVEEDDDPRLIGIECVPDNGDGYVLTPADIAADSSIGSIRQHPKIHIWTYESYRKVTIPPKNRKYQEVVQGDRCKVRFHWQMDMNRHDRDLTSFRDPTIGVKIIAQWPPDMDFFVDGYELNDGICNLQRFFDKGQVVAVRWLPKPTHKAQ